MSGRRTIPQPLRAAIGSAVLVGSVRVVDALWRRITGRPTPVEARRGEQDTRSAEPAVVRDRLLYALLLGGALRAARRSGLPDEERRSGRSAERDGRGVDEG